MKDILSRLAGPLPKTSHSATVQRRLSATRYELRDDLGRIIQADSDTAYAPGVAVLVQAGRIVARVGTSQNIKTYEV
jgi:phosphoglucomutase